MVLVVAGLEDDLVTTCEDDGACAVLFLLRDVPQVLVEREHWFPNLGFRPRRPEIAVFVVVHKVL